MERFDRYYPEYQYKDVGVIGEGIKWKRMHVDHIPKYRAKNPNRSLCATVQRFKRPQKYQFGENRIQPLVFDLDHKETKGKMALAECIELLHSFSINWDLHDEHVRVYFSGFKGFHLIIPEPVLGIPPNPDLHRLHKRIAEDINISLGLSCLDLGEYKARQPLRLLNTRHAESKLFKIEVYPRELRKGIHYIRKLAQKPRGLLLHSDPLVFHEPAANQYMSYYIKEFGTPAKQIRFTYPCVQAIYKNGPQPEKRHKCSFAIALSLKEQAIPEHRTLEIVLDYNRRFIHVSKEVLPKVEANVRSQIPAIYKHPYRIGCKESFLKDLLKQYCKPLECPLHKPRKGFIQFERSILDSSLFWNEKHGLRRTRKVVYEALRSWDQIHSKANNPVYNGKKAFYVPLEKLTEIAGVSRSTARIALEELIYVGFIQRVPQIELPPDLRRQYGRRVSNYYIAPNITKQLLEDVYKRIKTLRGKIKGTVPMKKFRSIMGLPDRSVARNLIHTARKLLKKQECFTTKMLKEEGFNGTAIKRNIGYVAKTMGLTFTHGRYNRKEYRRNGT